MTSLLDGCKESVDARQDKALFAHNAGAAITLQDCLRSFRIESGPNLREGRGQGMMCGQLSYCIPEHNGGGQDNHYVTTF
ncbi:hypothetical protein J6590_029597 [Homalodisca vitripennis]|nr:hypothetical protein J6590_029597 [Homalodisca vitripennis]